MTTLSPRPFACRVSTRVYALIVNGIFKATTVPGADDASMPHGEVERVAQVVYAELRGSNIECTFDSKTAAEKPAFRAEQEITQLTRIATDTQLPSDERVKALLTAHQRRDVGSCLCGWAEMGKSHAGHQAELLAQVGLLA